MKSSTLTSSARFLALFLCFILLIFVIIDSLVGPAVASPAPGDDIYGVYGCSVNKELRNIGSKDSEITFVAFGDTQVGGPSKNMNIYQIRAINRLEKNFRWRDTKKYVRGIRGVIIAGDITENAYMNEYKKFASYYGICGNKLLRYPVYEGYGNHDFARTSSQPIFDSVSVRNKYRISILNSAPGKDGHYSWDWGDVHFIHLNLAPSDELYLLARGKTIRFTPRRALTFLRNDLRKFVRNKRKRVVIISHYGFLNVWDLPGWWPRSEANRFYNVIKHYNVIALIHGHHHGTRFYRWRGLNVFNVGSPFYQKFNHDGRGHFTLLRITANKLVGQDISWDPKDPGNPALFRSKFFIKRYID